MKHSLLVLVAVFYMVAVSCKKETKSDSGEESKQKYAVQFEVDDFEQSMVDFDGRKIVDGNAPVGKDSLQKYINYLYYSIYGSTLSRPKRVIQKASDPDFGTIKDSLPMGRYTLAVLGTTDTIRKDLDNTFPQDQPWLDAVSFGYASDAFYKKLIINVDGELREKVSLSRILARLSINIKDKMPYSAATITMLPRRFPDEGDYSGLYRYLSMKGGYWNEDKNGPFYYYEYARPIPEALRNTTNNTFDFTILMLDTTRVNIAFSVKDNNGKVLGSKKMLNIPFKPNRKVTLSGNLFDGLAQDSSGASIIVNPEWNSVSNPVEF